MSAIADPFQHADIPEWIPAGAIGARVRALPWKSHPLGPISRWPHALQQTFRTILASPAPMWVAWGPELVVLYNDACIPLIGDRHPDAFGRPIADAWERLGPLHAERARHVLHTSAPAHDERVRVVLEHAFQRRETFQTFAYSPLAADEPAPAGVLCVIRDDTPAVHAEHAASRIPNDLAFQVEALKRLHELSARLMTSPALDVGLDAIINTVVELHDADAGLLLLHDPTTGELTPRACVRSSGLLEASFRELRYGACGWAFATGARAVVEDIRSDPRTEGLRILAARAGFQSVHSTPIMTRAGRTLGVLSVFFAAPRAPARTEPWLAEMCAHHAADIIEAARIQQALRESEARFRALALNAPAAIFIKDLQGRYTMANPIACETFGRPAGIVGLTDAQLFPPAHAERMRANDEEVVRTGRPIEREETVAVAHDVRSVLAVKFPLIQEDGRVGAVCGVAIDITARREAEARSHEAALLLAASIDALTSHIAILDHNGVIIKVNEAWRRFADVNGYAPHGFGIGSSYIEACTPDPAHPYPCDLDAQRAADGLRAVMNAERDSFSMEYPCHSPTDQRWFLMRVTRFGKGPQMRIVVCHDNVTERHLAEQVVRDSAERLRLATEATSIGTWDFNPLSGALLWDARTHELLDVPLDLPVDYTLFLSRLHPEDREATDAAVRRALDPDGHGLIDIEYRTIRPVDASDRWLRATGRAWFEHGRAIRFIGTVQDITDRRRAEADLRESEQRFRAMADNAPVMVWVTEHDGHCSFLSKSWYEFTGCTPAEGLGRGWTEPVHPEDRHRAWNEFVTALVGRRPFRVEYRLRRHDGEYRWALDSAVPRFGADGRFLGFIGSVMDISEQVLARRTLEHQHTILEDAVRARTQELEASNERLRIAERMASLGTLSAGLGHDMGNLLVPLRVRLESLSRASLSKDLMEDVEAIRSAAEYLQRLAAGLRILALDPSRAPRGERTDLATWWSEVRPLLKNALPRTVELRWRLDEPECVAEISRAALTQAVFNLVQNAGDALRHSPAGAVSVIATTRDDVVCVVVSDNGPGMSPDVKARCMEPFFTTKTRGISTGLGLALVYGLIRDAGGAVDIASEPGAGTTITLQFKKARAHAPRAHAGNAIVFIADLRLRAFVHAELHAAGFLTSPSTDTLDKEPDVIVTDTRGNIPSSISPKVCIVLNEEIPGAPDRPKMHAVRDLIRRRLANKAAHHPPNQSSIPPCDDARNKDARNVADMQTGPGPAPCLKGEPQPGGTPRGECDSR